MIIPVEWMLENPAIGWVAVMLYLFWEIRGPGGKVKGIYDDIGSIILVVRALARSNGEVDTDEVNEFLADNGTEPGDFLKRTDKNPPESDD